MPSFSQQSVQKMSNRNGRLARQVSAIKQGSKQGVHQVNGIQHSIPKGNSVASRKLPCKESANATANVRTAPQQPKASPAARERRMLRRQSEKHVENKATWQANKLQKKPIQLKKYFERNDAFTSAVGGTKRQYDKPWRKGDRDFKDAVRDNTEDNF